MKNKIMRKFIIWYRAKFKDYPYWYVIYPDGQRTRLLYYREAKGCAETFKGKLYIDYETEFYNNFNDIAKTLKLNKKKEIK